MSQLALAISGVEMARDAAPAQGITAGTNVLTLDGELPVQFLAPGDRVITRAGARKLIDIEVSLLRGVEMVRISASALGHDKPEADLFVAPTQPVFVRDWRAQALFGRDSALVEAQRLTDGEYIRRETVAEVRLFTLRFAAEEVVYAGGLELACTPATVTA